jgi:antitoxin MazE
MHVSKWGNSLAVRLPKALVDKLKLKCGDELAIVDVADRTIAVEKRDRREAALARMASRQWSLPESFRFDRDEANAR